MHGTTARQRVAVASGQNQRRGQRTIVIKGTDNVVRCERATLLAIDVTARPKHTSEPIPHEDFEARNKLSAEAGLQEQKTVLG